MIPVNPMVILITSLMSLLSQVGVSWQQSDSCMYQGQPVVGEFTIPGFCLLYRCIPGQGVTAVGCGIRIPPEGCFVEHPDTKNYPECCHTRVVCPDANSINTEQQPQIPDELKISSQANLGYSRISYDRSPAAFTTQQKYPTERPQMTKTPPDGATSIFSPKSTKRRPNNGFTEPRNINNLPKEESLGSAPYYYKK